MNSHVAVSSDADPIDSSVDAQSTQLPPTVPSQSPSLSNIAGAAGHPPDDISDSINDSGDKSSRGPLLGFVSISKK